MDEPTNIIRAWDKARGFEEPQRLNLSLFSTEQVRELDRIVIEETGVTGYELMQRAGRFSYDTLKKTWLDVTEICVFCGSGNNAGDGYVLAKLAAMDKKTVSVVNCFNPEKLKGDAKRVYQDLLATDVKPINERIENCHRFLNTFDGIRLEPKFVIVDAIFGTGLKRNIDDDYLIDLIESINCYYTEFDNPLRGQVLSIDIPSGLNADTGSVMGAAIKATVTATFMGTKKGMLTNDGPDYSGKIVFDRLDIQYESYKSLARNLGEAHARILNLGDYITQWDRDYTRLYSLTNFLILRKRNSHKGNFGHVLIIGGDEGYLGASQLAAQAAMRVGAGLVSVATRKSHAAQLSIAVPEIMCHGVETLDELMPLIKRANVIAIGPGLGQSEWAKLLFARVLESDLPIIIDADALNLLSEEEQSSPNWVITPHPGEASRLLKTDVDAIQSDRFQSAKMLHEKYQGPVVLKGCGSIVADSRGNLFVCDVGNPGMSSGGMGDVLTGTIAGFIAQGIEMDEATYRDWNRIPDEDDADVIGDATKLGVLMHAYAADLAAGSMERGLMATDLMPYLRKLANYPGISRDDSCNIKMIDR
jgi:NAD(P)H-hydrate epimerase